MADSYTSVNTKDSLNVVVANTVPVQGALKVGDTVVDASPEMRPVLLGAKATSSVAQRTLVADSRMMGLTVTPDGRLITLPYGGPTDVGTPVAVFAPAGAPAAFTLIGSLAAGVKSVLLGLLYSNTGSVANQTVLIRTPTIANLGRAFIRQNDGGFIGPFPLSSVKSGAAEAMQLILSQTLPSATELSFTPIWYSTKD